MRKKYYEVGRIELVAGAPKSISIPPVGVITKVMMLPRNGSAAPASVAKVTSSIDTITLSATYDETGKTVQLVKGIDVEQLLSRELYFASVAASEADVLVFDPSASLDIAAYSRRYLDIGTADLKRLSLEIVGEAALDGVDGVSVWVEYEDRQEVSLGAFAMLGKTTADVPAAGGDVKIDDIPTNDDGSFQITKIDIELPTDFTIDYISVVIDHQTDELKEFPVYLLESLLSRAGRKPQAGIVTIDFNLEAFAEFFLPGQMKDFKIIPHFVNGGTGVASQIDVNYELLYI